MSVKLKQTSLSRQVRRGKCGTTPKVLTRYLDVCDERSENLTREQARRIYISAFNVILETICDDLVARCWRNWCLDNITRPLGMLRQLSHNAKEQKELALLEAQKRLLSRYFMN